MKDGGKSCCKSGCCTKCFSQVIFFLNSLIDIFNNSKLIKSFKFISSYRSSVNSTWKYKHAFTSCLGLKNNSDLTHHALCFGGFWTVWHSVLADLWYQNGFFFFWTRKGYELSRWTVFLLDLSCDQRWL